MNFLALELIDEKHNQKKIVIWQALDEFDTIINQSVTVPIISKDCVVLIFFYFCLKFFYLGQGSEKLERQLSDKETHFIQLVSSKDVHVLILKVSTIILL